MNSKSYLIFPTILTGKAAEIHKASRRKVVKFKTKGAKIDGITPNKFFLWSYFFKTTFLKTTK